MTRLLIAVAAALAIVPAATAHRTKDLPYSERLSHNIAHEIRATHRCQIKLDRARTPARGRFVFQSIHRRRYVFRRWRERHHACVADLRTHLRTRARLGSLPCYSCWERVASCESGGDWGYNGGSGFDGGLQFLPSTWLAYGGGRYAPYAYMATKQQQIAVASTMSLSHWPVCGSRY